MNYQPMRVPPSGHPLIRQLFAEINRQGVTHKYLESRSGVYRSVYKAWRQKRHDPCLTTLAAVWGALGYDITVTPNKDFS